MSDRRIFLGMPVGYGRASIHAARAFFRACKDSESVVKYHPGGSLLASSFNQIWCAALNAVHQGGRVDYFAMLHDDVAPEDYWLDKLIDELEAKNLDILSAVVPIKDNRGLTSMCLDRDGSNWFPLGKLSMRDVFELPETFTSDDLGHPLLLNTGCWVIKWNQEVCKKLHFEINDRIVFDTKLGRYLSETEPEDWFFSRQAHELGLRLGATRKVELFHFGEYAFPNHDPWGSETFDAEMFDRSPVPLAFPYEIPGWLKPEEGRALSELARGKRVLEIGSFCGLSTVCMARAAEHVTAVDYFDGRATPKPQNTREAFDANIRRYGLEDKVTVCHPDDDLPEEAFDLAFIDGAHDYDSVRDDIFKAMSALKPEGILAFHDYRVTPREFEDAAWDPGVTQAVNELLEVGGELISRHATVAVVRPPAAIPLEV
jgi:predicted O-methyltransferase YrrM